MSSTATFEIETWIQQHGNARDALNVAIARLNDAETQADLQADHEALQNGEIDRLRKMNVEILEALQEAVRRKKRRIPRVRAHLQIKSNQLGTAHQQASSQRYCGFARRNSSAGSLEKRKRKSFLKTIRFQMPDLMLNQA